MQSNKAKEKLHRNNKEQPKLTFAKRLQRKCPKTLINKIPNFIGLYLSIIKVCFKHAHPHWQVSDPSQTKKHCQYDTHSRDSHCVQYE